MGRDWSAMTPGEFGPGEQRQYALFPASTGQVGGDLFAEPAGGAAAGAAAPRKRTVFEPCPYHAAAYAAEPRYRRAEAMAEGGWGGSPCPPQEPPCPPCQMKPGTDFFTSRFVLANPVYVVGSTPA